MIIQKGCTTYVVHYILYSVAVHTIHYSTICFTVLQHITVQFTVLCSCILIVIQYVYFPLENFKYFYFLSNYLFFNCLFFIPRSTVPAMYLNCSNFTSSAVNFDNRHAKDLLEHRLSDFRITNLMPVLMQSGIMSLCF